MEEIEQIFEKKTTGFMHGFTLGNFLQYVEMEDKTCTIKINSKKRIGYLYFYNGTLINAQTNGIKGQEAVFEILCWEDTNIEIQDAGCDEPREIEASLASLLLEAARLKDEKDSSPDEEKDLAQAINRVASHRFQEAITLLTKFLKTYPKNHLGWLWYSRCAGSLNQIQKALNQAIYIAPGDPEVRTEIQKLNSAQKNVGEGKIRHCPFCWTPLNHKASHCHYCGADLFILKNQINPSKGEVNVEILSDAIVRYRNLNSEGDNVHTVYYLAIAHYNLNHWDDVLDLLNKAVKLAPDQKFFSQQLNMLLNYIAATGSVHENNGHYRQPEFRVTTSAKEVEKKKKILVVEDSSTTRKVIVLTLKQQGYTVIDAKDGLEALSKLNETRPDLILLDIILPNMDGYKVLSIIKENPDFGDIPVIMLTSKNGILNKMKSKVAGSAAYLTKPFEPAQLVETIERYLK
ncbi:hypothetical protein D1BOALGB6SA_9078 [Olavius sp. associated proteobacterium Delta 1]|nr:hypothetical protein D1BOALGB6SA_9078 [Olavius sp. associated proteobacterium Delta 1]